MTLLISPLSFACEKAKTSYEGKPVTLCFDKKNDYYFSESCKDIAKCFFGKKITLETYPNQSPGFSLCYQIEGHPFFARIEGVKGTVPLCEKDGSFVDHELLMKTYKKVKE